MPSSVGHGTDVWSMNRNRVKEGSGIGLGRYLPAGQVSRRDERILLYKSFHRCYCHREERNP
jgi:hypothetical protein